MNNSNGFAVELENGAVAYVESTMMPGEVDIAVSKIAFGKITSILEGISQSLLNTFAKVKPTKGTVEFGIELGVEAGELTALIVKGTGKGNLIVTLEWEQSKK